MPAELAAVMPYRGRSPCSSSSARSAPRALDPGRSRAPKWQPGPMSVRSARQNVDVNVNVNVNVNATLDLDVDRQPRADRARYRGDAELPEATCLSTID